MANEDRNGVFLTVPSKVGKDQPSVREWEYLTDKETGETVKKADAKGDEDVHEMYAVKMPMGTMVNGQDISYYELNCTPGQLDPGGQKYSNTHSVLLNEVNGKGEDWNLKLTKQERIQDDKGNWTNGEKKTFECTTKELQTGLKEQYASYKEYRKEHAQEKAADKPGQSLGEKAKEARQASGDLAQDAQSKSEPSQVK